MRERVSDTSLMDLARVIYSDGATAIHQSPNVVLLLDLTLASLELERAVGEDFGSQGTFLDAMDLVRSYRGLPPWLYGGGAHVGWTAFQFARASGTAIRGIGHFDEMILDWIVRFPPDEDVDLPSGLLGLGVYGLAHPDPVVREKLTSATLEVIRARTEDDDGIYLRLAATKARLRLRPQVVGHRDLGIAHGNAGLVSYLGSVAMSGLPCAGEGAELVARALTWLLRQRSTLEATVFPHSVESRYEPSRSAWCYGDPGVALALAVAAEATGSAEVATVAREAAEAAVRRPTVRARVVDACLCHGAAGLSWFGRRAADEWGLDGARDVAEHWSAYIRDQRRHGPLYYVTMGENRRDYSFLDGDLGVALALVHLATGLRPHWEERLLACPIRPLEAA